VDAAESVVGDEISSKDCTAIGIGADEVSEKKLEKSRRESLKPRG